MLDKFGLNAESTEDERCLLINPAIWRVPAAGEHVPFVDCVVEKDELKLGQFARSTSASTTTTCVRARRAQEDGQPEYHARADHVGERGRR